VRSLRAGDFFCRKGEDMEKPIYRSDSEIRDVVEKFESCSFPLQEFTHARHLTVACWYLCTTQPDQALARMRAGLQRFIVHHGREGYHETITRFWMELLGEFLRSLPGEISTVEKINHTVEAYSDKDTLFQYYTREFVMSEAARREWVEPDVSSWKSMAMK
jgi:hypothetical protein